MDYKDFSAMDWALMEKHLPNDYNFRQFKIFKKEKDKLICTKVNKIISDFQDLKKILLKEEPAHAYISVCKFLNPHKVKAKPKNFKKAGYKFSQNIFLGADLVIDVDTTNIFNRYKIIDLLRSHLCFKDIKVYETKHGFHIWVLDFQDYLNAFKQFEHPHERENYNQEKRKEIADYLKKAGCKFDYPVSIDTRRIVRLPYSIYGNELIIKNIPIF